MGDYTYSLSATHCSDLSMFMDQQRKGKDENLCDVCFKVGDESVFAHRSILAIYSAYFQGLLSGAFSESQGEDKMTSRMMEMDLTGYVSNTADLDTFLSSIYTGSLSLSFENISGVTVLACFLLVERVRSVCEAFMLETLNLHTCLPYLKLSFHYDLTQIFHKSHRLLKARFHDFFIHQPEMLTVSAQCLEYLTNIYRYVHQQDVVQFLVQWVGEGEDGVDLMDGREARLSAACRILNSSYPCLKTEHLDTTLLAGNKVVISNLVGQCLPQKCSCTQCSDSSQFQSGERSNVGENVPGFDSGLSSNERNTAGTCQAGVPRNQNEEIPACSVNNNEAVSGMSSQGTSGCVEGSDVSIRKLTSSHYDDACNRSRLDCRLSHSRGDNESSSSCSTSVSDISNRTPSNSTGDEASPNHSSLKRDSDEASHLSDTFKRKRCRLSAEASLDTEPNPNSLKEDRLCDALVAFVPNKKVVHYCLTLECELKQPRLCNVEFEICLYSIQKQKWLWVGTTVFPGTFTDRDIWRVACCDCKAYFVSLFHSVLHVLDLKTLTWSQVNCQFLNDDRYSEHVVRSLSAIAVNNTLYVLASDKALNPTNERYACNQRYYRLDENNQWHQVAEAVHFHNDTPLTMWSVSNGKVYVVKGTVAVNFHSTFRHVQGGHIFDCVKGEVTQFEGNTYATSPIRVLVHNDEIHTLDGDSHHRRVHFESQIWEDLGNVDISDIKIQRAVAGDSFLPCLTHSSCSMGSSVWELGTMNHHSSLTELRLGEEGKMFTVRHPPPPFRCISISSASQFSEAFVSSLKQCHYLHLDQDPSVTVDQDTAKV